MRKAEWSTLKCIEEVEGFCREDTYYFVYKVNESQYVFEDLGGNISLLSKDELEMYFESNW